MAHEAFSARGCDTRRSADVVNAYDEVHLTGESLTTRVARLGVPVVETVAGAATQSAMGMYHVATATFARGEALLETEGKRKGLCARRRGYRPCL